MAEKIQQNQFDEQGVNPFNAPVPGESLTASPDTPTAWERPPEFTDQEEAMRAVYMELTEQTTLRKLVEIIDDGVALDEIAQVVLYKGYRSGKFNPDMVLLLAEPTILSKSVSSKNICEFLSSTTKVESAGTATVLAK